jgi:hypothetical protein
MGIFIFQSVPARYNLRVAIEPGKRDTWYATRYRGEMHPGNPVFFWMAGAERGLYGWGHIDSEPYLRSDWNSHGVDVIYDVKFIRPILAESLRADSILSEMLIFRAPQATNFLLPRNQAERLIKLVQERGERVPPIVN